ncbi:hypothetical protein JMUB6875_72330 [Nocardia sp. JMUB6875]|uniref:hypothetical protein n=1 Tax=Nocardia sp. JMUB6875 TaxID=3158170 RepID=UPI0032E68A72
MRTLILTAAVLGALSTGIGQATAAPTTEISDGALPQPPVSGSAQLTNNLLMLLCTLNGPGGCGTKIN